MFACECLCTLKIFSLKKKINRLEIVLITSFYYTTEVYPYQPTYREFICTHSFLFVIIYDHLWELFIHDHLCDLFLLTFMKISKRMNSII